MKIVLAIAILVALYFVFARQQSTPPPAVTEPSAVRRPIEQAQEVVDTVRARQAEQP